ncbi:UNKNOWN [Stylonychia lemnae]|uniref:Uncharacterized protein n=1 Tax=Stylonychia lemnae TaxID=5949 RepID=A0A077ZTL2_STYLE|nr:UNKNOWN [Stylonychia lemnae]CDW89941.1 UNKNOWN [Stylonychia lemnae]|eukprot:CDW73253.1 UNKNOWN [Stylonychia lemnae]
MMQEGNTNTSRLQALNNSNYTPTKQSEEFNSMNLKELPDSKEDKIQIKHRMNICQWISFGFLTLVFLFLLGFLIYQWSTWSKQRINRYG